MATRAQAEAVIAARAAADSSFKSKLMANPEATLAEALGAPLPDGVKVTVLEETSSQAYIVIPAGSEVSEKELAGVAGGCWIGASSSCGFVTG
tara:strand:- start:8015 stop:8293 length:279 start_codon:yes stop_codon:yes gene_type:complete